jgi:hypothetical protein
MRQERRGIPCKGRTDRQWRHQASQKGSRKSKEFVPDFVIGRMGGGAGSWADGGDLYNLTLSFLSLHDLFFSPFLPHAGMIMVMMYAGYAHHSPTPE